MKIRYATYAEFIPGAFISEDKPVEIVDGIIQDGPIYDEMWSEQLSFLTGIPEEDFKTGQTFKITIEEIS